MSNIKTLQKVVSIAEKRRDEALTSLAQVQREWLMAKEQMDQLKAYAKEAEDRWVMRSGAGVDAALLHHHRHFMHKVEHAIEFQRGVLSQREALVERNRSQVYAAERDLAGLRKYTERKQEALDLKALRQEQKTTDEMALNIYMRQNLVRAQQGLRS
jgi:flagellar FliJ protein